MSVQDIIRAWKDASYRSSLSLEEQALLPTNPVGAIELTDEDLGAMASGYKAGAIAEAFDTIYYLRCCAVLDSTCTAC